MRFWQYNTKVEFVQACAFVVCLLLFEKPGLCGRMVVERWGNPEKPGERARSRIPPQNQVTEVCSMAERMLITKLVRTEQTRAELYARGHQWPDLKLFDLSDLLEVGIDPNGLPVGQEVPCRFWAIYELSEKLNKAGNPYKDVIALERMDGPATATSTDTSALLAELRAIRELLETVAQAQGLPLPAAAIPSRPTEANDDSPNALDEHFPRYRDGNTVSDNPHEQEAYDDYVEAEGKAPENVSALRQWVLNAQDISG
jgi:hypothetical protein